MTKTTPTANALVSSRPPRLLTVPLASMLAVALSAGPALAEEASPDDPAAEASAEVAPAESTGSPLPLRWGERARPFSIRAVGEVGFLAVLAHDIQFGRDGTYIDYQSEGGQETLAFVGRLSVELTLYRQHRIVLLYQPLTLATTALPRRDWVVDDEVFEAGTPMNLLYDFPFYRIGYMYDVFADPRLELSVGAALQIRNATITFASADGEQYRENRDVGPVPLLSLRALYYFDNGIWIGSEIVGLYAPISYLNGSDTEVTGAILDASVRAGLVLPRNVEAFLNVRYLGGGAVGQSDDEVGPGDGYVRNWLHFMTVSLGVNWDIY